MVSFRSFRHRIRFLYWGLIILPLITFLISFYMYSRILKVNDLLQEISIFKENIKKTRELSETFFIIRQLNETHQYTKLTESNEYQFLQLSNNKILKKFDSYFSFKDIDISYKNFNRYCGQFFEIKEDIMNPEKGHFFNYLDFQQELDEMIKISPINDVLLGKIFRIRELQWRYMLAKFSGLLEFDLSEYQNLSNALSIEFTMLLEMNASSEYRKLSTLMDQNKKSFSEITRGFNSLKMREEKGIFNHLIDEEVFLQNRLDALSNFYQTKKDIQINNYLVGVSLVIIISIVLIFAFLYIFSKKISDSHDYLRTHLEKMSRGELPRIKMQNRHDGIIFEMSVFLSKLLRSLKRKKEFIEDISKGEINTTFVSDGKDDILGNALLKMRDNIIEVRKKEEQHKEENRIQNWQTNGLAKFANILNFKTNEIAEISYSIVVNLVDYLNATVGGLYIFNEDEKYFELVASYAFNRDKLIETKIRLGEGMVGLCALERKKIYLLDIPEDYYLELTSGMGKTKPRCILLYPLIFNDKPYGVIELASLNKFEDYEVGLVEKIAENIASTIFRIRINMQTEKLLRDFQEQSNMLTEKEEELRQNMEEMQATQEEMERHNREKDDEIKRLRNRINQLEKELLQLKMN